MDKSLFSKAAGTASIAALNSVRDYVSSYMNKRKVRTRTGRKRRTSGFPYAQTVRKPRVRTATKLRRSVTRTKTVRRKRRSETITNPADLSAIYKSGGKRLKLSKLVRANKEYGIYQYAAITPYGGSSGSYFLRNFTGPSPSTIFQAPIHLYDLTSCSQVTSTSSLVTAAPCFFLRFTDNTSASTVSWENLATAWTTISSPNLSAQASTTQAWLPGGRDIMEYVNVDLLFYAPSATATRIKVAFVQITEDELHPTNVATARNTAFWQAQAKRYVRNPLETMDSRWSKYIKVLKQVSFYMDPKETTETVNARVKRVRLFHRFNRICNYNWQHSDTVSMVNQDEQTNLGSTNQTRLHPRARIYLMICGQARTNITGEDPQLHPSYDINLKVKHAALSSVT